MKIAVPTRGNLVDDHFGHCEAYTVFDIDENKKIIHSEMLPSPARLRVQKQYCICIATKRGERDARRKYGEWCIKRT